MFSSNSKTTSPLDSNNNNFNVPFRTNLTDFRLQYFLRERKAHVMTPHNTNATTCPGQGCYITSLVSRGVETIYRFGFGPEQPAKKT